MKRILLLIGFVLSLFTSAQAADIEARTGVMGGDVWGLHMGALVSFRVSDIFYFQPGALVNTVSGEYNKPGDWNFGMDIPLYASFRMSVDGAMKVRLNAGPFIGLSSPASLGTAVEGGIEYHKYYVGVSWMQNLINENSARLHFSIGYKFAL